MILGGWWLTRKVTDVIILNSQIIHLLSKLTHPLSCTNLATNSLIKVDEEVKSTKPFLLHSLTTWDRSCLSSNKCSSTWLRNYFNYFQSFEYISSLTCWNKSSFCPPTENEPGVRLTPDSLCKYYYLNKYELMGYILQLLNYLQM